MKLGVFSNQQRHRLDVTASWEEDLREIVVADELGFSEAWVSEHKGLPFLQDGLALPDYVICKAAALTERIMLGPGVRILPMHRPLDVAVQVATCDHLTNGRYIFGFGRGGPGMRRHNPWTERNIDYEDTAEMALEAGELIAKALSAELPFDWEGRFFAEEDIEIYPKPIQKPHPPIAIATATASSISFAAQRGWRLLMSQYARPASMRNYSTLFRSTSVSAGLGDRLEDVIAVRAVFVAETDSEALEQVRPGWCDHLEYNKRYFGPVFNEWLPSGGGLADLTFDGLLEEGLIFVGSPETISERLMEFYSDSGGFGTLLVVAGKDWGSLEQRLRSLELLAQEVLPAVNGELCTASI